jgi:hypothetical protein
MDTIDVDDAARLVRELRAAAEAESTIQGVLVAASRVFRFARRRCGQHGDNPIGLLEASERPRLSDRPERRIYEPDELAQVLAASWEPWTTIFRLADVAAGRESGLLALWWSENLDLSDLDAARDHVHASGRPRRQARAPEERGEQGDPPLPALGRVDAARAPGA